MSGKGGTKFLTSRQNVRKDSMNAQGALKKLVSRNKTKWNFASEKNIKNSLCTNKTKRNEKNNEKNVLLMLKTSLKVSPMEEKYWQQTIKSEWQEAF